MNATEIRAHILLKGKTLSQFAGEIGTTKQNVHSIITSRTKSPHWRQRVADFIEKPVAEVFPEQSTSKEQP